MSAASSSPAGLPCCPAVSFIASSSVRPKPIEPENGAVRPAVGLGMRFAYIRRGVASLLMGPFIMMSRLSLLIVAVLAATAPFGPAQATSQTAVATQRQWGVMDKCARMAIAKFPDHTAADLNKR